MHGARFVVAQQGILAGGADAFQNRGGVGLSPSQAFCVVSWLGVAFNAVEFADAVEDIFRGKVALLGRDDEATSGVDLSNRAG